MSDRSTSLFIATVATLALAGSAQAQGLKQVGTIALPDKPITQLGVMTIDQTTGLGYLAEKDNKAVVVFDTKTDKYVSRIAGFIGQAKSGNVSGPNGVLVVDGGAHCGSAMATARSRSSISKPVRSQPRWRRAESCAPMQWRSIRKMDRHRCQF